MEKITLVVSRWLMGIRKSVRNNRKEAIWLGLILLIGAFFRLYRIGEYMTFLGDEGRDAIIVRRLLVNFDPILIGPRTSIGDMYLGPLYYYMMAPFLLLFNFSPVGPSVMVALLGVVTIFFVWYVVRKWFYVKDTIFNVGALIAAGLYAISPVVITYSKSSWNPNIMPFFALLSIYGIWKVWYEQKFGWLIVVGVSMAFVLQSHYLGLLLIPTIIVFWLFTLLVIRNKKKDIRNYISLSLFAFFLFTLLMSPLVIFDARHGWRNFTSINKFFTERQTTVSLKIWKGFPNTYPIFKDNFIVRIITGNNLKVGRYFSVILITSTFVYFLTNITKFIRLTLGKKFKDEQEAKFLSGFFMTFIWLFIGILGLGIYKQHVYDHYFGFIFPAPFILIGAISEKIYKRYRNDVKIFLTAGLLLIVVSNLKNNPLLFEPNRQMTRAIEAAKVIKKEAGGEMFNLAVIAQQNYEDGYQYFLEKERVNVVDIDPLKAEETTADQLFVVCELAKENCDPTHNPKTEVANFGWSKIAGEWETSGVTIYKLVHNK